MKIAIVLGTILFASAPALAAEALDRVEMVAVAGGPFTMGSNDGPDDERPAHLIELAAFEIDRLPVSNVRFAEFLNAIGPYNRNGERLFDDDDADARIHRQGARDTRRRTRLAGRGNHGHPARPHAVAQPSRGASQRRLSLRHVIAALPLQATQFRNLS